MELVCSVHAEPLPMQILALANNAGKANQVCDYQPEPLHGYSSMLHHIYDCLLTCHDVAGCSNDLCRIGKPLASTLGLFGLLVAACTISDECLQAPTAGIDIPQRHELAFLPNIFPGSVNGHKQANLL